MANGHGGARAHAGKKKGQVHASTRLAKTAIEDAFAHLQGEPGKDFPTWCKQNTDDFYKLLFPKLLPVQLNHADAEGEKLDGFRVVLVDVGKSS